MTRWWMAMPLAVAACAPTAVETQRAADQAAATQDRLATALRGFTPGPAASCVDQVRLRQAKAYGSTLIYTVNPRLVYRTDTSGGCERVGGQDILITSTPSTQLCRGDIARTVDRASQSPTGSCTFGDFVPYRRP